MLPIILNLTQLLLAALSGVLIGTRSQQGRWGIHFLIAIGAAMAMMVNNGIPGFIPGGVVWIDGAQVALAISIVCAALIISARAGEDGILEAATVWAAGGAGMAAGAGLFFECGFIALVSYWILGWDGMSAPPREWLKKLKRKEPDR
ncbi:MAG TPA: hypothetical protein PKV71_07870 [Calditrichia bacterium]|nr:hypothetical protein [Calditrichota bacterium]HQV31778.1 hypothetical protein [Calditrichia bacterium]